MATSKKFTVKSFLWSTAFILAVGLAFVYFSSLSNHPSDKNSGVAVAIDWNRFMLDAEAQTEGFRGPVTSRTYAYVGLAAYEAALPGLSKNFRSMSGYFPELELPSIPEGEFSPEVALNACYASILGKFFLSSPKPVGEERLDLATKWENVLTRQHKNFDVVKRSREFGERVADAVFAWSATDKYGHLANHHIYDRSYAPPVGEGLWKTSVDFPMPPLLPYWGKVRPFVIQTEDYVASPLPAYSSDVHSTYYTQALEVLTVSSPLSAENQWIAEFWNDDHPLLTFTPPGHWLSIVNQVVENEQPTLEKALETYLKTGFALADAMIATWNSKYIYNLERPESFIQKNLSKDWRPFSPAPPFPSYPSGHSVMGAAAAEVLTNLYGDHYQLTDKSHDGREHFIVKSRRFNSFHEMAIENSLSRILLGVHFRMDCEEGLRLGALIGKQVATLELKKGMTMRTKVVLGE